MAQQLLLEGKDPQELLQQAHQDYGPHVSVVRAEKVRSGGVMGFFARESYVLTVEVPDNPAPAPTASTPPSTDRAALAAEEADVAAIQRELLGHATPSPTSATSPARASAVSPAQAQEQAAAARRAQARAPIPEEPVSPTRSFESEMDALLMPEPPVPHQRAFSPVQFPAVVSSEGEIVRETAIARQNRAAVQQIWPRSTDSPTHAVEPAYHDLTYQDGPSSRSERELARDGELTIAQLLRLGVPVRMLPDGRAHDTLDGYDVAARLAAKRARKPKAGDVLVLAGEAELALRAATQVAFWQGVPVTDVVLAGPGPSVTGHGRRILGAATAARVRDRAPQARAEGKPVIVALGISPGPAGKEAAATLQAALGADLTWAVIDAGLSDSDRQVALEGVVGGAGDVAVAAMGIARAQAPAAVVDTPWPVAWLDGLPASRAVWAAVLDERAADNESTEGPWSR